ncbi:hypothetical protein JVU11DRAFT_7480 [Chiua virens]|nr:hypothetical protein JVU11DRAFT_7480 [Chiua virens]
MHARAVIYFWFTLLAMFALALASPVPEPEPAPVDSSLSSVISSNLNMGCQNGCEGAASAQQLNANAALDSSASPLSILGGLVLASGVLAAL